MQKYSTTLADLSSLPASLPVWSNSEPSAASVLGIGRALSYAMAADGRLPIIRCGRAVRVSTTRLLAMLGEQP